MTRDEKLIELYRSGHSMREVGEAFDISFERVRKILRRSAPHLIRPIGDTRNHSSGRAAGPRRSMTSGQ